ncbi:MAG: hypothetical protein ACRC46_12205 [Thermoguttaceae bacterium]
MTGTLFSLLESSEQVVTFGNTRLAYGFKDDATAPQSLGDVVVSVLRDHFGGGAKRSELSSYCRDELKIVRLHLTPYMVRNHPMLVVKEYEIYLAGGDNAS